MDAEFLQLAQAAVVALQGPSWVDIAQLLVSGVGLGCIVWGLFQMRDAGKRRDREIDELGKGLQQQGRALEQQGAAMTQAFTLQAEALGKIGQALDRQGAVMTQALTQQGQALERQGEVLAELLRRPA